MISAQRPVIGSDLLDLRERLQLSSGDMAWLLGLSMTRWMLVVNKGRNEPVRDPTLALLVRALDQAPEANPIPAAPTAEEVFSMAHEANDEVDKKKLSIMFGSEASSGYRWITTGSRISPVLARLFYVFKHGAEANSSKIGSNSRGAFMARWNQMVETEANARGVPDIWKTGRWTKAPAAKKKPAPAKRSAVKKK